VGGVGGVGGVEFDLLIRVVSLAEYCSMKGQLLRFDETPLLCLVTDTVRHLYVDSALVVEHHPNPVLELVALEEIRPGAGVGIYRQRADHDSDL